MRVIGGNARGRRLKAPKGPEVRPTAARVKEALFNILPRDLSGVKILDLYAGTGNITIEALSRGAAAALLVDASAESAKAIRENLRRLHLLERTNVWVIPVARAVRRLAQRNDAFDIIFLDPPYGRGLVERTLKLIGQESLLSESGVVVAEHSIRDPVEQRYGSLVLRDRRRYGDTMLSFFQRQEQL